MMMAPITPTAWSSSFWPQPWGRGVVRIRGRHEEGKLSKDILKDRDLQGVPLKSPPLNFSKCRIVENMAES